MPLGLNPVKVDESVAWKTGFLQVPEFPGHRTRTSPASGQCLSQTAFWCLPLSPTTQ